jgi:hypothetical protein
VDELVLPDHDLLDQLARPELDGRGVVKGGCDLSAEHQRQVLDAIKVGMLCRCQYSVSSCEIKPHTWLGMALSAVTNQHTPHQQLKSQHCTLEAGGILHTSMPASGDMF